jgi:hypothetical protein
MARTEREADRPCHNCAGTEHVLLGLIRGDGDNAGSRTLNVMGIGLAEVRQQVERIIGPGQNRLVKFGSIQLSPRACRVLELSRREALRLGHDYIGSEHILLGLIAEEEGAAPQVLVRLGANLREVRTMPRSNLKPDRGILRSSLLSIYGRLASIDATLSALHLPRDHEPDSGDSYHDTPQNPSGAKEQSATEAMQHAQAPDDSKFN